MKQETIERLRGYVDSGEIITVVFDKASLADILAVLEAARDYAQAERKYRGAYSTKNAAAMINANAALLALIDLETK